MSISYTISSGMTTTFISSGVPGTDLSLSDGDTMYVYNGGTANRTMVNGGRMHVYNGGTVNSTKVNVGGALIVSSGGTANEIIENGGYVDVVDGANAVFASNTFSGLVLSKVSATVHSGTTVNSATINGGTLIVSSGGMANGTMVKSYGRVEVSSGGTATVIDWTPCVGHVDVYEGGTATFVSECSGVYYGAEEELLSHATTMDGKTLNSSYKMYVMTGGMANDATVNGNGRMYVCDGGTANGTTVNCGSMYVSSGGTANGTTVKKGCLYVSSGGTATGIDWTPCVGYVDVYEGGTATFDSEYSGVYYGAEEELLSHATTMDGKMLNSAYKMYVMTDGAANDATVNGNGRMYVSSGGTANRTTVNGNGRMYVRDGGTANSTTVNSGGSMYVSSGGTANSTTVNSGGSMYVSSGGTANSTTVNSGGSMYVSSGGTANSTTVKKGYLYVSSGGTANSTTVNSDGRLYVSSGGTANSTTVNSDGRLYVSSGGTANSTTVKKGYLYVSSGGTASDIIWMPCEGHVFVSEGGYATFVSQYSGVYYGSDNHLLSNAVKMDSKKLGESDEMCVMSGGTANRTTVRGELYVYSGGTANRTTVKIDAGMHVYSGGTANSTTLKDGGTLFVESGATANSTTVDNFGDLYVSSGGTANCTTVKKGTFFVESGGTANSTMVKGIGELCISSGGTATDINWTPCAGHVFVSEGGYATFVSQYSGVYYGSGNHLLSNAVIMDSKKLLSLRMEMCVMSGGTANSTTVKSGRLYVSSGGTANSTTVDSWMYVSSGGTANSTTVNEDGWMYVYSGGMANGTTVNAYGHLDVSSGGKITGQTTLSHKEDVSVVKGSIIDFDVSGLTPGAAPRINNLSLISGWANANYTLTVSAFQSNGKYSLADGAKGFNKSITVVNTSGTKLGTLTVGSTATLANGRGYTLTLTDGLLALTLAGDIPTDTMPPTVTNIAADITDPTIQNVTVTADFADDLELKSSLYRLEGEADWHAYPAGGVVVTQNTTVYFKAVDAAGNTTVESYAVTNIEKKPSNDTLFIDSKTVNTDVTEAYGTILTEAGQAVYLDQFGSVVDNPPYNNHIEKKVDDKIDVIDYAKIVLEHGAKLSFHAEATAAATFTVYSLTQDKKGKYTLKSLQTLKLTDKDKDGLFTTDSKKPLQLQVSGAYYVSMKYTDKRKDVTEAYYNVKLNDEESNLPSVFYDLGDNTDDWGDMKTAGYGGAVGNLGKVTASGSLIMDEWIGFGDKVDYKRFTLESAAELSFALNSSLEKGPLTLTVCRLKTNVKKSGTTYSEVKVKSVTLKAGRESASLNNIRLAAGDYYLKVETSSVKKSTGYGVQVAHSDFYTDGDNGWNNVLLDGKNLNENAAYFYDNTLSTSGAIHLDKDGNNRESGDYAEFLYKGETYGGFVCFGDETDFAKLTLSGTTKLTFSLSATNDATLEIFKVTQNGAKYAKKSLQTVKYKAGSEIPATSKKPLTLEFKDGVSYYVSVKATNVKKTTVDPRTYYNVSYAVESSEACALAMPETASDELAMSDSLSFGQYADADVLASASASSLADLDGISARQYSLLA